MKASKLNKYWVGIASKISLILLAFIVFFFLFPVPYSKSKLIYISKGSNTNSIAKLLKSEKLIYSEYAFRILTKVLFLEKNFVAGEFAIRGNIGLLSLLKYITNHNNIYYNKITIVEGLRVVDIIALINSNNLLSGEITSKPKEGTLMPDTYFFVKGATKDSIISSMQSSMAKYLNELWQGRNPKLPYKNKEEALILASIVEKESSFRDERALIAGVFLNRLKKGMKLQTDPTVAYGLNKISADKLTKRDLATVHPYNTYIIKALPPSPIANPSRQSLRAVFYPEETQYLYFVADGSGGHIFASNLNDHNKNVLAWRKIEKKIRAQQNSS